MSCPSNDHRTAVRPRSAGDHVQQGGLPRTRRADHRGERGRLGGERNMVQQRAIALDRDADVAYLETAGLGGRPCAPNQMCRSAKTMSTLPIGDDVVLTQVCVLDALAVDESAIAAGVLYLHAVRGRHQTGVVARGEHVRNDDVVVEFAPDGRRSRWRRCGHARRKDAYQVGHEVERVGRAVGAAFGWRGGPIIRRAVRRFAVTAKFERHPRTVGFSDVDRRARRECRRTDTRRCSTNMPFVLPLSIATQ